MRRKNGKKCENMCTNIQKYTISAKKMKKMHANVQFFCSKTNKVHNCSVCNSMNLWHQSPLTESVRYKNSYHELNNNAVNIHFSNISRVKKTNIFSKRKAHPVPSAYNTSMADSPLWCQEAGPPG